MFRMTPGDDFFDPARAVCYVNPESQCPQLFHPVNLQRTRFLSRCFHFHESHPAFRKQQQPIRDACHAGGNKLERQAAGIPDSLDQLTFQVFFHSDHPSKLSQLVTVTRCLIFGGRSSFVTVVYSRFQNFPLEEFSENSALKGVLELTVHGCHTFMITAAHPAASGPAHTGLPWFSDD